MLGNNQITPQFSNGSFLGLLMRFITSIVLLPLNFHYFYSSIISIVLLTLNFHYIYSSITPIFTSTLYVHHLYSSISSIAPLNSIVYRCSSVTLLHHSTRISTHQITGQQQAKKPNQSNGSSTTVFTPALKIGPCEL